MNILCASSGLVWPKNPKKGFYRIQEGGFENVFLDFSAFCPAGELENFGKVSTELTSSRSKQVKETIKISEQPEELGQALKLLLEESRKKDVCIGIARAPYLDMHTKRGDLGELLMRLAEESIRACRQADCGNLIVRPLFSGIERGCEWEKNRSFYLGLADIAKQNRVMILLENQCRDINGNLVRGICSDAREAALWVDRLNAETGEERFGFCMNVGTCSLCGQDMREFAILLGSRIKAVILCDCDGIHENALIPFTCIGNGQFQTDWLGLIRGLREIEFDGSLIMDFSSVAAVFSQFLHPQLIKFARGVAGFFEWQISMKRVLKQYRTRVLFGAGNMCRNFMKCYGDEFPPLFTCDNNKVRWGTRFEGLEIKPPDALKELPSDCAIFICSIYYKEIEKQLGDMEVSNPIEYFNDEYMPSYYFDTLEYWEGDSKR